MKQRTDRCNNVLHALFHAKHQQAGSRSSSSNIVPHIDHHAGSLQASRDLAAAQEGSQATGVLHLEEPAGDLLPAMSCLAH